MQNIPNVLLVLGGVLALRCTGAGVVASDPGKGVWEIVRVSQHEGYYHALSFSDERNGWVVGDSGRILKTTDGGDTWNLKPSGSPYNFNSICSVGSGKVWIGGSRNTIGRTTDGGETWTWRHFSESDRAIFLSMSFVSEDEGWAVDNSGGILRTMDGGNTWASQESGTSRAISSVHFSNFREGCASAMNRDVLYTSDGGNTWKDTTLNKLPYGFLTTAVFSSIFSFHSRLWVGTNVMASNYQPQKASVVFSPDAGRTWFCQATPEETAIEAIRFVDENLGWAGGFRGILHTSDAGEHWAYQYKSNTGPFVDISFVDKWHGWALTFGGTIYRYHSP